MKQYAVITNDGTSSIYAENKFQAWDMASDIFTDVIDVQFVNASNFKDSWDFFQERTNKYATKRFH